MPTSFHKARGRAASLLVLLAVLSATILGTIAFSGRSEVTQVTVKRFSDWTFSNYTLTSVSLPFIEEPDDPVPMFIVTAKLELSPMSSRLLRITPDDCIESITINDGESWDISSEAEWRRCWPSTYLLDGSSFMQSGENAIRLTIRNKDGPYGVDITSVYTQPAIIVMVFALWVLLYILLYAVAITPTHAPATARNVRLRFLGALSPFGVLLIGVTLANVTGEVSLKDRPLVSTLAAVIPALLLVRCLDAPSMAPMPLRRSVTWSVASIVCFVYASLLIFEDARTRWTTVLPLLGITGSILAMRPAVAFLQRARNAPLAVAAALIAAIAPHAYWDLNLTAWGQLSGVTVAMVRGVLWAMGLPTSTFTRERLEEDGRLIDYHAYVASQEFVVEIGSWCSGFEGVALFLFLLSLFVLLDWPLFSKVRHLWAIYLLTVPFVLAVNALRIAGLFIYAVWNVREHGRTHAIWATIEAFHSNIGWVIYGLAFALFLPLVYRWAKRAASPT